MTFSIINQLLGYWVIINDQHRDNWSEQELLLEARHMLSWSNGLLRRRANEGNRLDSLFRKCWTR